MNNKKNCPFKKRIEAVAAGMKRTYKDTFAWCDGEKCMAYANGKCLRLSREENTHGKDRNDASD